MIRLFIEEQEMDVTEGFSHQITYAIDDLQNLDSKATAFSKTIVLPGTANNNRLLGNVFEFGNSNQSFTVGANVGYSFNASKSAKARLEVNGLQVMKGVMRLMEIIRDGELIEYEVALFGELGGFVSKLGNLRLEDLDFSEYNQAWNVSNIQDSWELGNEISIAYAFFANISSSSSRVRLIGNYTQFSIGMTIVISGSDVNDGTYTITNITFSGTYIGRRTTLFFNSLVTNDEQTTPFTIEIPRVVSEGVYYPLIDYGNVSVDKINYSYRAFRPAFFVREYLDKIIKNSGYTWESKFFNSDFFCRLIIPNNEKGLLKIGVNNYLAAHITTSRDYHAYTNHPLDTNAIWDNATIVNNFGVNGSNTIFTYTGSVPANVKISGSINGTYISVGYVQTLYIKIILFNTINNENIEVGIINFSPTDSNYYPFNFEFSGVYNMGVGSTIRANVYEYGSPVFTYSTTIKIDNGTLIVDSDPPGTWIEYEYNENLLMNSLLPKNIFQKDFFTSILKMFYLMVTEDKQIDRHLIIEPYVGFYNLDPASYLDWSDNIDRSQVIKIKPMSELNARYYSIKYKSDNDFYNSNYRKKYNEGYGDVIYDNGFEFAKETDATEVIFAGTPLVGYDGKDKIVSTIFNLNNAVEDSIAHVIRIMQVKKVTDVASWNIYNATTNLVSGLTIYPYAGHFDDPDVPAADINFGTPKELFFTLVSGALQNNLFNSFYSNYLAEITDKDSRLVTATIKLNEQQIFNLDFGRFIYLDGILYRIQRIIDYTAGELCKVELLRVIYTSYGNELNPYEKYTKITFEKNGNTASLPSETLANFNSNFTDNNSYTSFKLITLEYTYELYLYGGNNIEILYGNLSNPFDTYTESTIKFEDFGCIAVGGYRSFNTSTICDYLSLPLMKEMTLLFGLALGYDINDIVIKLPALEVWINPALSSVIGKNIELTIPHAMMIENAGSPNTELQNFIYNNNVTIFEV